MYELLFSSLAVSSGGRVVREDRAYRLHVAGHVRWCVGSVGVALLLGYKASRFVRV